MFKQLKNKMLFLNLSIFSILLIIVFSTLYLSTYTNINNRINEDLDRLLNVNLFQEDAPLAPPFERRVQAFAFSFIVVNGDIVDTYSDSEVDLDTIEDIYQEMSSIAGTIEVDDYTYRYKSFSLNEGRIYAVIDMTNDQELLSSTLMRYILIFFVSLFVTTIITNFITNRSIKPIKDSYQKQKEFVANASHELKTPLTVINTNIDVLLSDENFQDNKWLSYIKDESVRMNKLTEDLLYLAKTGEDTTIIQTTFNAVDVLENVLLEMEAVAYEKGLTLDYDFNQQHLIQFNPDQFKQVCLILLDNAIKYTPKGNKVIIHIEESSKHYTLSIKNLGVGINEEDIQNIFERFYKADKSRQNNQSSFGLGLSILKQIVENNHAHISVESDHQSYTEFSIKIKKGV